MMGTTFLTLLVIWALVKNGKRNMAKKIFFMRERYWFWLARRSFSEGGILDSWFSILACPPKLSEGGWWIGHKREQRTKTVRREKWNVKRFISCISYSIHYSLLTRNRICGQHTFPAPLFRLKECLAFTIISRRKSQRPGLSKLQAAGSPDNFQREWISHCQFAKENQGYNEFPYPCLPAGRELAWLFLLTFFVKKKSKNE